MSTITNPGDPYITVPILLLIAIPFLTRNNFLSGLIPLEPFLRISGLSDLISQSRISYTAHNLLDNTGPILVVEGTLTPDNIAAVLNHETNLDPKVIQEIGTIRNTLKLTKFLNQASRIFIHSHETGLVTVQGPNTSSKHVISIRV